jgi:hypothetical protein
VPQPGTHTDRALPGDRRLCRPSDCADLHTACVALLEIPTRDIGTILSGARQDSCASARLCAQDMPAVTRSCDARESESAGTDEVPRSAPAARCFARQLAMPQFGPHPRGSDHSDCADLIGLLTPLCGASKNDVGTIPRSAQSAHCADVGTTPIRCGSLGRFGSCAAGDYARARPLAGIRPPPEVLGSRRTGRCRSPAHVRAAAPRRTP